MTHDNKCEKISLEDRLASLPLSSSNHCIPKVHEYISKSKSECYKPLVISIGPLHYNKPPLDPFHELKLRHLQFFLKLSNHGNDLGPYKDFIRAKEDRIRSNYAEKLNLTSNEFIEMVLIDAAFIIIFFIRYDQSVFKEDPMENRHEMECQVKTDLFLVENQLPFFVLYDLFDLAFGATYPDDTFNDVSLLFIRRTFLPGSKVVDKRTVDKARERIRDDASNIKHLVDFLRICCLPAKHRGLERSEENGTRPVQDTTGELDCLRMGQGLLKRLLDKNTGEGEPSTVPIQNFTSSSGMAEDSALITVVERSVMEDNGTRPIQGWFKGQLDKDTREGEPSIGDQLPVQNFKTAKELKAAGVKFMASGSKNLLDITFLKGVLQIPTLTVQDSTESILRNILFFEQCHYYYDSYIADYLFFIDELIDTPEDVKILVQNGIIKNLLGSDDEVANLFNEINKHIVIYPPGFYYAQLCQRLNAYANTRCNQWVAILRRDYFKHPWAIISFIFAIIFFVLTVLRTINGFTKN